MPPIPRQRSTPPKPRAANDSSSSREDEAGKSRPFTFHGIELHAQGPKNMLGDCPFCGKEDHFSVNRETGQFICGRCSESGNVPTFLAAVHKYSLKQTSDALYKELAKERGLKVSTLKRWELAFSFIRQKWLIPAKNADGKLANLYLYDDGGVLSSPDCLPQLFNVHRLTKAHKKLWVCEGPWDAMAWEESLGLLKQKGHRYALTTNPAESILKTQAVVASPGCGNFRAEWARHCKNRDTIILFDNDYPKTNDRTGKVTRAGWDGTLRTAGLVVESSASLEVLKWGKDGYTRQKPDHYDIRDLYKANGPLKTMEYVSLHLETPDVESVKSSDDADGLEPIQRDKFVDLIKDFKKHLHFPKILEDTLAVMLATMISTKLGGEHVWLRVIGPPSSAKSTLAMACSGSKEYALTPNILTGFHSGFTGSGSKKARSEDASLVTLMDGKTVIIKDGDTLVKSPNRDRILSELRDLYDGESEAIYRNRIKHAYKNHKCTFILAGTEELRQLNQTMIGERFLDCDIYEKGSDLTPLMTKAVDNAYKSIIGGLQRDPDAETDEDAHWKVHLRRCTYGFLKHSKETLNDVQPPKYTPRQRDLVMGLAELLSYMRARVGKEAEEGGYRPQVELPARIAVQLTKLAVCLAIVLDKSSVDDEIIRIIRKVVIDTGTGYQAECIRLIYKAKKGLTSNQLHHSVSLPETTVRRLLANMQKLGIVVRQQRPNNSGIRGRDTHLFQLSPLLQTLCRRVGL